MGNIGFKDLVEQSNGEPQNVLDLPQVYTKPTFTALLNTLISLKASPLRSGFKSSISSESPQERAAIAAYLTRIISCGLSWLTEPEQERILEEASLRLSERSGRTAMPSMTRMFSVPTSRGPLQLDIYEPSLTGDDLGLKTWGSAFVLASRLESVAANHIASSNINHPLRVIELGSGTGLVGIAAAAIWQCSVALTDQKEIISNTARNAELNQATIQSWGGSVNVDVLDWNDHPEAFALGEVFDVIIVADPLYDLPHAPMLTRTIARYLSRSPSARVIIELPLRDTATQLMADNLRALMSSYEFVLLADGEEEAFDDWEGGGGELAGVRCWWGVWGRTPQTT